jgi:predicted aldo/keto reductase-like oxidoreductase
MKRRNFLRVMGGAAGAVALQTPAMFSADFVEQSKPEAMPQRELGRTGMKLSVIGFPGLALNQKQYTQEQCNEGVKQAFAAGVNYFDTAPAYGTCEERMGIALQGLDRKKLFVGCKTKMRDAAGAKTELERSLQRLKTDYFDLYQIHHLRRPEEVQQVLGPGGAMETIVKAREEGRVKAIGFSAHTTKAALAALRGFKFDSVMFPITYVEFFLRDFGREVMELANEKGASIIAMKYMCKGAWLDPKEKSRQWWYRTMEEAREVNLAVRWSLSQKGVVTGIAPSFLDLFTKSVRAGYQYQPITAEETAELRTSAKACKSLFEAQEREVALHGVHGEEEFMHAYYNYPGHECSTQEVRT